MTVNQDNRIDQLVGLSYRDAGDCWYFAGQVIAMMGLVWPSMQLKRGSARHAQAVMLWEKCFVKHDTPLRGRLALFRVPKSRRVKCYPYRWHCGVMLDTRWFIHAAARGVMKTRMENLSYGPFLRGYYSYAGN